ncbi:MAG: cytochrome P450 [Myxococcales bacterium]|nr:cytochrome P450 [Myxococcales bacterium]
MPLSSNDPSTVDLGDVDLFAKGAPYDVFARLRRDAPVHWNAKADGAGFWNLTRHPDVFAVSQDSTSFSSADRGIMIFDPDDEAPRPPMMIEMDPPTHTRYRSLVNRAFTPRRVAGLRDYAAKLVEGIVGDALAKRRCDFVRDVAAVLPLQIILEMMGVDPSQRDPFFDLANRVMGFSDPEFGELDEGENVAAQAEMAAFARRLAEEKALRPGDDLASELLSVEVDGEKLTPTEFDLFFLLLVTAGSETTRSAIAGGVRSFHQFPEQWRRLGEDRSLLPAAIEEILRYTTPIHHFRRTATRDLEIRGTKIRAGDKVVVWYSSANRDEDVFVEPNRFDVARTPNEQLSFGFGRHFCLGANLARLELRVMLEALLDRDAVAEPAGPVEYMRSNFAHSMKRMPVDLVARS